MRSDSPRAPILARPVVDRTVPTRATRPIVQHLLPYPSSLHATAGIGQCACIHSRMLVRTVLVSLAIGFSGTFAPHSTTRPLQNARDGPVAHALVNTARDTICASISPLAGNSYPCPLRAAALQAERWCVLTFFCGWQVTCKYKRRTRTADFSPEPPREKLANSSLCTIETSTREWQNRPRSAKAAANSTPRRTCK